MKRRVLDDILAARAEKRPVALITDLESGVQGMVTADEYFGDLDPGQDALQVARDALRHDRSGRLEAVDGTLFAQVFNPPARLLLVGAVHISQPLAPMAALAGYAVTVVDPRRAFATDQRFPGVAMIDDWPDDAMAALAPDSRTAVVTLTHDPKLDDPALQAALNSEAFYIGALGSRKTHAARLERLRQAGFDDGQLARIHGPVGLGIGARSPAEIAVSILAQITQVLHRQAPS
jgi:xanthine dehydrogenase accessory factor